MDSKDVEVLREISNETGVNGVSRLVALFSKRFPELAKPYSSTELSELAKKALETKADKQILKPPEHIRGGRIHADSPNEVWQMDTASMIPAFKGSRDFLLVAVDIFTRKTYAEPISSASAAETKRAMISFDEFPKMVDTDQGPEYKGEFDKWIKSKGIAHRVKDPKDLNALAAVDRKIQQIKHALSGAIMRAESDDWVKVLPKIIEGLNEAPSSALLGKSPDEVEEDDVAVFDLQKENARKGLESQEKQLRQKEMIAKTGTVRQLIGNEKNERFGLGPKRRGFLPVYGQKTQQPERDEEGKVMFFGDQVNLGTKEKPQLVPVRHMQAVAHGSEDVEIPLSMLGGGKLEDTKRARMMPVVQNLASHLEVVRLMFWRPNKRTFRERNQQDRVVIAFLRQFLGKGIVPGDLTAGGWRFLPNISQIS